MSSVDVIIPCYNYAKFLQACVESVLSQPGVDVRVLILDDASPDNTPEVCAKLASMDSRVAYRRHTHNQGHIATYNEGLEWAGADYTLLLSADDLLVRGSLAKATQLMDGNPEVALCYGKEIQFTSDRPLPEVPETAGGDRGEIRTSHEFLKYACERGGNFIPTASAVVRTSVQKELGGYRKELPHSGDLEMWLRFGAMASVGVLKDYQAYSRMHANNMRLQYPGVKDYEQVKAAFDTVFQEYGQLIDDRESLKSTAYGKIAERAFWAASNLYDGNKPDDCQALLSFAQSMWPEISRCNYWLKFQLKRKLRIVWPFISPIWDKVRQFRIEHAV